MIEGGAGCLIKQHKWFESHAVATLVVYMEHKVRIMHRNTIKASSKDRYRPFTRINLKL